MGSGVLGFVGGAFWYPKGLADFEAPGAALDGFVDGEFGEEAMYSFISLYHCPLPCHSGVTGIPLHRSLHLFLIIRHRRMHQMQRQPYLLIQTPPNRRTNHPRPQNIASRLVIS